jgi:hypothetical protein
MFAMRYIALVCVLITSLSGIAAAEDTKAEDLVTKHLDSIGTPEARAAVKSCAVQGALRFRIVIGGQGDVTGTWGRVSEQHKSNFVMKFPGIEWKGERFAFDGDKTSFAAYTASHKRSEFGEFVSSQEFIVKEGLLGGELSTDWALENLDRKRVKLNYLGIKKIGDHELEGIEYFSKGNPDMSVKLYFDPESHHHVMTVYSLSEGAIIGHEARNAGREQDIHRTIEEHFSNFQTDNGITLPRHYDLEYRRETLDGSNRIYDWDMTADKILTNLSLDPANFQVK